MTVLTDALRTALDATDLVGVATDVKSLVCDELARVDPDATIRRTDYFNHTYVPDVVIEWPSAPVREVFLRFLSPETAHADVERVGRSGPVVFDLSTATAPARHDATTAAATPAVGDFPRVLVTDAEATEFIRPEKSANLVEHLVMANLLRAGRGQLTRPVARAAVVVSRAGFDGAVAIDAEPVRAVVTLARSLLNDDLERRVERFLQLLWWAGGGDPEEFPTSLADDMTLNPGDTRDFLRMVFDGAPIEGPGFWARLADRLDFEMLVEVGEVSGSENLNRLMTALARSLTLSHAALDRHERPLPPFDALSWAITDRFLRLSGPDWSCRFTPQGNRFSQRRDVGQPISLETVLARSAGLVVESAELEEAARRVRVTRKASDLPSQAPTSLAQLTSGFAPSARVRGVVVRAGDALLTAEYDRMMLGSEPNSSVLRMATIATKLLTSPTAEESADLLTFLGG